MSSMPAKPSECLAEFTGTFLLVLTVGCNVLGGSGVWAGVSIACVLMVCIFAFGAISGANFNPAVSVALGVSGAMNWAKVGIYSVVQLVAGILAGFSYRLLFTKSFDLKPSKGFNIYTAGACELLYTFMLCFVVLNVAAVRKGCQSYFGLAIGFVIVAGAYGAGYVSGGCFNPAVAWGIELSSYDVGDIGEAAMYTIFEGCGALLAAICFKAIRLEGGEEDEEYSLGAKLMAEFLGTYMLVLTVGLNVNNVAGGCAFSIAASLMCMIYALGDISGANFNPAVSLSLLVNGSLDGLTAAAYMAVQVFAGALAGITYTSIWSGKSFPLGPKNDWSTTSALSSEGVFTFLLCLVVLCVGVMPKTASSTFFGLAIGSCITVGGNAIGSISGGSLNPAVSFGIATPRMVKVDLNTLQNAFFYSSAEFAGAILAAGLVMITHVSDEDKAERQSILSPEDKLTETNDDKAEASP